MSGHKHRSFPQQMDLDGRWHDLSPEHLQDRLFTADPQIAGQMAIEQDTQRDG